MIEKGNSSMTKGLTIQLRDGIITVFVAGIVVWTGPIGDWSYAISHPKGY